MSAEPKKFHATPETFKEVVDEVRAAGGGVVHLAAGNYNALDIPELCDFIRFIGATEVKS